LIGQLLISWNRTPFACLAIRRTYPNGVPTYTTVAAVTIENAAATEKAEHPFSRIMSYVTSVKATKTNRKTALRWQKGRHRNFCRDGMSNGYADRLGNILWITSPSVFERGSAQCK
jgi:hypothetical protein